MAIALPTAGKLREKVAVQQETRTADSYGGAAVSWAAVSGAASLSAQVTPVSGMERARAMQVEGGEMFDVWLRHSSVTATITKAMRVVWRGRVLNIRSIRNPDERRTWLHLVCEEIAGSAGAGA